MKISFYFQKFDESCKKELRDYLTEKKLNRLERLLHHGNLELAKFRVHAEYFPHHNAVLVKLTLSIKKHEFIAEKRTFNIIEAFDIAFDNLIIQVRKLEDKLYRR
ncbi:HPF/RaiA family ribosome-associated protein [Patescibacteria group bacterium]